MGCYTAIGRPLCARLRGTCCVTLAGWPPLARSHGQGGPYLHVPSRELRPRSTWCGVQNFIQDGSKGEDFNRNLYNSYLDFATIHVYPQSLGIPGTVFYWVNDHYIGSRAVITCCEGHIACRRYHVQSTARCAAR